MNVLKKLFFSMEAMVVFVAAFTFAIAAATFIENDFGSETARAVVYNAPWFKVLMLLIGVNLAANMIRFKTWRKPKRLVFFFHLALLVILIGAGITTIFGYEGLLHIREGETSERMLSRRGYLILNAGKGSERIRNEWPLRLSRITRNRFSHTIDINGERVTVRYRDFIPNAKPEIVADVNGRPIASLMVSEGKEMETLFLREGDTARFGIVRFSFETEQEDVSPWIRILQENGQLFLTTSMPVTRTSMADREQKDLKPGRIHPLEQRSFYTMANIQFALQVYHPKGRVHAVPSKQNREQRSLEESPDALIVDVIARGQIRQAALFGKPGMEGESEILTLGELEVGLAYGSKSIAIPFGLELVDFEIERYPGSRMPSSYASEVIVLDEEKDVRRPYRIYMNHILKYRGYRFFQYYFDPDERGTVLSVSSDPGTIVTTIGYGLLFAGLILNFINRNSRFRQLGKKLAAMSLLLLVFPITLKSRPVHAEDGLNKVEIPAIDRAHRQAFGRLLVQDAAGRIKPLNTFGYEWLRSVSGDRSLRGIHAERVALGLFVRPDVWQHVPVIRVDDGLIRRLLGMDKGAPYASYADFFDPGTNQTRLLVPIQQLRAKPRVRYDRFDKALIETDARFNACRRVFLGRTFRIFPEPGNPDNAWFSFKDAMKRFTESDRAVVSGLMERYLASVLAAMDGGDWSQASAALEEIAAFQERHGSGVLPPLRRVKAEVLHNEVNLFRRIVPVYGIGGILLLILGVGSLFSNHPFLKRLIRAAFVFVIAGFILHTAAFALRWAAAAHAPWSNKYESMVYIAWAAMLAGLVFSRRSAVPPALAGLFACLILRVAHLPGFDPKITNLVPVLKSHWLVIHVSVITSSYGFLGLGAVLAFFSLLLFIFKQGKFESVFERSIRSLTMINERSLIVGLSLLTIGNFLGAVWANESWGRYWGWDPKETWTLITILVYAVVVHLRLVPGLSGKFTYNVWSMLGFGSVMMTYFGVNTYLSGLHSYAQGDPVPIPPFVYATVAVLLVVIVLASRNRSMGTEAPDAGESAVKA